MNGIKSKEGLWIASAEAAKLIGVASATIRAWIARGLVESQFMGGSHFVLEHEIRIASERAKDPLGRGRKRGGDKNNV